MWNEYSIKTNERNHLFPFKSLISMLYLGHRGRFLKAFTTEITKITEKTSIKNSVDSMFSVVNALFSRNSLTSETLS